MADIPFDDRDGSIWINGEFVPWRDAKFHFLTHSLHYGGAVFEGIRVYNGKAFKLKEHNERLLGSCNIMDIVCPYTVEELNAACEEAIKINEVENGYIRPLVWRGSEEMGIGAKKTGINCGIAAWEWPNLYSNKAKEEGISLITSSWKKASADSVPCQAKVAGLYATATLAKHAANRAGYDDALMHDYRGYIAEATSCNFFFVKDKVLHTAVPDCFLNGITRQTVIDIADDLELEVNERHIAPEELKEADECFVTGTGVEIVPVSKIDDIDYEIGPITKDIIRIYSKMVNQ